MIRGDIWWVDFGDPLGSEPGWRRPAIIVQSDDFNKSTCTQLLLFLLQQI